MSILLTQNIRISNAFNAIYVDTVNTKATLGLMSWDGWGWGGFRGTSGLMFVGLGPGEWRGQVSGTL